MTARSTPRKAAPAPTRQALMGTAAPTGREEVRHPTTNIDYAVAELYSDPELLYGLAATRFERRMSQLMRDFPTVDAFDVRTQDGGYALDPMFLALVQARALVEAKAARDD